MTTALLALFPIALGAILLIGFRVPARRDMPAAYAYYLLVLGILGLVAVHVIGLPDPLMGRSP